MLGTICFSMLGTVCLIIGSYLENIIKIAVNFQQLKMTLYRYVPISTILATYINTTCLNASLLLLLFCFSVIISFNHNCNHYNIIYCLYIMVKQRQH